MAMNCPKCGARALMLYPVDDGRGHVCHKCRDKTRHAAAAAKPTQLSVKAAYEQHCRLMVKAGCSDPKEHARRWFMDTGMRAPE